jgi:hypothetical protein
VFYYFKRGFVTFFNNSPVKAVFGAYIQCGSKPLCARIIDQQHNSAMPAGMVFCYYQVLFLLACLLIA